jgi:hypothetical protein
LIDIPHPVCFQSVPALPILAGQAGLGLLGFKSMRRSSAKFPLSLIEAANKPMQNERIEVIFDFPLFRPGR